MFSFDSKLDSSSVALYRLRHRVREGPNPEFLGAAGRFVELIDLGLDVVRYSALIFNDSMIMVVGSIK